jgi:hypothetical protein
MESVIRYWTWLFAAMFMLLANNYANAALTDIKFGQYQIADSQWNVNACLYTDTCQIYSKNPGTAYKIPWTSGQISWASGDYIKFEISNDSSYPYLAKQYDSAGNVKATIGTGKIVNMGADYFFFVGNDNNTGQLFSGSSGMSNTSGVSWTGTLNPSTAQADTYADANYSTVPLSSGQTATVTPSSQTNSPPPTTTCNPCSPQGTNLGFESGTTANWTLSNGSGTEKTSGWSDNGEGVQTSKGMNNYQPGGGKTWTITPYGTWMMVIQAGGDSPTFDQASADLGLTTQQVQDLKTFLQNQGGNSNPTNASWAKRTVTLEAGKKYVVAWQYLSTDYVPFNDGSMMTLTGPSLPKLNNENKNYALLGFTNPGTGNYSTDSYGATGWQLATIEVTVSGDYTLGFASFNLGDTALSPMLFVDDLQGTTTLNGTVFAPVAPNPGSNAPVTGGGSAPACPNGSACSQDSFGANTGFANRATVWSQQTGNRVIIEQVGNYNVTTVNQAGNKNYAEIDLTGSNNSTSVTQSTAGAATTNYIELTVNGNSNTTSLTQNGTSGTKGIYGIINNSSNELTVNQSGTGNHYAEVSLSGGNKSADITQSGTVGHMVKIELTGGATSITTTQQGSTQQFYSITHNCAQTSCAAITVTQGQ